MQASDIGQVCLFPFQEVLLNVQEPHHPAFEPAAQILLIKGHPDFQDLF